MSSIQTIQITETFHRPAPLDILSESSIYRSSDNTLHWIDLLSSPKGTLQILSLYTPDSPARKISTSERITCIRFIKNHPGKYICTTRTGVGILDEKTGDVEVLKELIPGDGVRWSMNDGAVDERGRFWFGEVDLDALEKDGGKGRGRLWRFDGEVKQMDEDIFCGNGIGWSPDGKYMYFNDSGTQILWRYDFDAKTGDLSNKTKLIEGFEGKSKEVFNDGLVIDQEGNIWIAMWMGHCVEVYAPDGKLLKRIEVPAKCPTCPAWGGVDNSTLFIVSAPPFYEMKGTGDRGGDVFKYEAGVKGIVNHEFVSYNGCSCLE